MTSDVQRDLGKHGAEIEQLKDDVSAIRSDMHDVKEMMSELRGGKKAVGILIGSAATVGAFLGWLASVMHVKPDGIP